MNFTAFPSARIVRSEWLSVAGRRLDCNPYMSGAVEAREALSKLPVPKDPLGSVTSSIFDSGRESRNWVVDGRFGVPYMGSSAIRLTDLSTLPLISKRQVARNPKLVLKSSWSLITRSGTIGRMAFVRPDMVGLACSEDVLRVVPNIDKINPGYLFGFLSSKYGIPLVISGTYGAIIQHIEPHHLVDIDIPRFDWQLEAEMGEWYEKAAAARAKAAMLLKTSARRLLTVTELPEITTRSVADGPSINQTTSSELIRLDATFFSPSGVEAAQALATKSLNPRRLSACARVFTPGIFKRMHVDDPKWGYPYYSGSELFEYSPTPRGFLSRRAPKIDEYLIERDWLLIQDAGQVGGLIGQVVRASASVHKSVVSNHLMRIAAESRDDSAYIFAVLASAYGYRAIVRNSFGSSIPQLDPKHIGDIQIPWLDRERRAHVAEPILQAWDLMDFAESADLRGTASIEDRIGAGSSQ